MDDSRRVIKQSELNRLVQQLHELREALRPFAVFAAALPPVIPGKTRLTDEGPAVSAKPFHNPAGDEAVITFKDLRHARTLLLRLEGEDEARVLAAAERTMAGNGHECRRCDKELTGSDELSLKGFCSEDCRYKYVAATGREV